MPRKGLRPRDRRPAPPADYKYSSVLVSRFINKLNYQGRRYGAQRVFYQAMDTIESKLKKPPVDVFNQAIENVRPLLEVRARRVGGATYQVPREVRPVRSYTVAMRWIIDGARGRSGKGTGRKRAAQED